MANQSKYEILIETDAETKGLADARKDVDGLTDATKKAAVETADLGTKSGIAAVTIGSVLGQAITSGTQALREHVGAAIELADKLDDLSARSGVSAEALQTLGNAASLNGGSLDAVAAAISKQTVAAEKASAGNKELGASFDRLKISASDLRSLSPEQLFLRIADSVAESSDRGRTYADVLAVQGRGAQELFATLEQGSAKIKSVGASMGVFGDDTVKALARAKDAMAQFENQIRTLTGTAIANISQSVGLLNDLVANGMSRAFGLSAAEIANFEAMEKAAAEETRRLQKEMEAAVEETEKLAQAAAKTATEIAGLDRAMDLRNLGKLKGAESIGVLEERIKGVRAEADKLFAAEGQRISFGDAADLAVIANGLKNGTVEAKKLAAELARYEDALARVIAEEKKRADDAAKASQKVSDALAKEIAGLREKQAALAAAEQATLNPARAAGLQSEQSTVAAQIAKLEKGGASTATPKLEEAGAKQAEAGTKLVAAADSLAASATNAIQPAADQLAAGSAALTNAAANIARAANISEAVGSLQTAVTDLAFTVREGFTQIANATATKDRDLQTQIKAAVTRIAGLERTRE